MNRSPRVLVIDDDTWKVFKGREPAKIASDLRSAPTDNLVQWVLKGLLAHKSRPEVYLAGFVDLPPAGLKCLSHPEIGGFRDADDYWKFIREVDFLLLDLGGVNPQGGWNSVRVDALDEHDLKRCMTDFGLADVALSDCVKKMNLQYPGASFLLKYRAKLERCQAVAVISQWALAGAGAPEELRVIFMPVCDRERPTTRMFASGQGAECLAFISTIVATASSTPVITNLPGIEFAACHDYPVLLLGESGSGKEGTARLIHRRWWQQRTGEDDEDFAHLQVVHCGALAPLLARSELFGHVKGSFTGADAHRVGTILRACGVRPLSALPATRDTQNSLREATDQLSPGFPRGSEPEMK